MLYNKHCFCLEMSSKVTMFRAPYLPNGDVPGQGVDNHSYYDSDITNDESNQGLDDMFDEGAEEQEEDRVSQDDLEAEDRQT